MDFEAIAIITVSGFVTVAIFISLAISISIIIRAFRGGGSKKNRKLEADETRMIQEIYHGLQKMEDRIESLETLMMDDDRGKRAKFDRELGKS